MKLKNISLSRLMIFVVTVVSSCLVLTIAYTGNGTFWFSFLKYIPGGDKTGHVVLLGSLSLSISWVLRYKGFRIFNTKIHYGVSVVCAFITFEEFCQILSIHRTFDLIDLLCNYIGILITWTGISMFEKRAQPAPLPTPNNTQKDGSN